MAQSNAFNIVEATIDDIHAAYKSGQLTCRQLVQMYLDRIEAFDKKGPAINAIITINSDALKEADRLDAAYKASGPVGPLHGIPVIVKDQADVKGMPTTLGSVLFKDYYPDRDSFVAENLRKAGAVILAKATLGELGGGDTHGSLFGSTRNPYDHGTHGRRFFRRFRRFGFSKFLDGGRGTGRLGIDPPAVDLERHHGHAPLRRPRQPRRRLRLLAGSFRLPRPHGAHRERFGDALGRHGRLRSRRSDYGPRRRPYSRHVHKVSEQRRAQRRAPRNFARVDRPQRRARFGRLQEKLPKFSTKPSANSKPPAPRSSTRS